MANKKGEPSCKTAELWYHNLRLIKRLFGVFTKQHREKGLETFMRIASTWLKVGVWMTFIYSLLVQAMVMISLILGNQSKIEAGNKELFPIAPLGIAIALLIIGFVLFFVIKKRRYIGVIVLAVSCVMFFLIGLEISREFPVQVGASGDDIGISTGKLITRHMAPIAVLIFMVPAWITDHFDRKACELRAISKPSHYDLSGDALFTDLGDNTETDSRPLKKSVRRRLEKMQNTDN